MFGPEPTNSPTSGAGGSRSLDSSPPMPPRQRRPPSVLFTPPADADSGLGELGSDPMVQDTMAMAAIDKAFQTLAVNHPEAVQPLAELQMTARQLYAGILAAQSQGGMMGGMGGPGMGAPGIVPPLPMAAGGMGGGGGQTSGQTQGPGM